MSGEQFVGASNHRLFQDWSLFLTEPAHVWAREWRTLATRAVSLVCNDPFAAAMVNAKVRETHGPGGMWLRSTYADPGGGTTTTAGEREKRRQIESAIRRACFGTSQDAAGVLTTAEFDRQMDWIATVMGDAWAVWVWKPGRPGASLAGCWRIILPDRVCNPDDRPDDERLQGGCELDEDGALVAIWIVSGSVGPFGYRRDRTWTRVPIYHPNGMRQVMHRVGMKLPGMIRGVSMFAPCLLLMRQIQGTVEAHVAGKRAQAIHPIVYFTEDDEELKQAVTAKARLGQNAVLGPMSVLVAKYGSSDVKFMQSNFQGSDLKEFLTTMYRSQSAMWGLPWQVVLCEMGEASLASARAGLDQNERTCATFGTDHQDQVTRIRDEAIIREEVTRGRLSFPNADWPTIMSGRYTRPPRYSTDRLKDANTIAALIKARVSPSTAHELVLGIQYEDEAEQTARDIEFAQGQGLPDPTQEIQAAAPSTTSTPGQTPTPTETNGASEPAGEDQTNDGADANPEDSSVAGSAA